jgi:hypothetical protein
LLADLLGRLNPIKTAIAYHGEAAPACLEGTRTDLLESITAWMKSSSGETIYWLSGAAGTGKTTVAQSVAKIAQELDFISASFFFSHASDDRRAYGNVIPTLAWQLGRNGRLHSSVCAAVELNDEIGILAVNTQVENLITGVLTSLPSNLPPCLLIVLDALDECKEDSRRIHGGDLIPVLFASLKSFPFAKLFVTSRRESSIERLFSDTSTATDTRGLVLHRDIAKDTVEADIDRYIRHELTNLKSLPTIKAEFPSESDIRKLVKRADGLFIYARTAIEYIRDPDSSPERQLTAIVQADDDRHGEKYRLLDDLYVRILANALRIKPYQRSVMSPSPLRNVLVTLVLARGPLSVEAVATLSNTDQSECERFLRRLSAVLVHDVGSSQSLRLIHLSFPDFLCDPNRCSALSDYRVDSAVDHLKMAQYCMERLNHDLHFDMCDIQDSSLSNAEVLDLQARLRKYVSESLRYACKFWAVHWLEHIRAAGARCQFPLGLEEFCETHLFHWIEVLSLIDALDVGRVLPELLRAMNVSLTILLHFI